VLLGLLVAPGLYDRVRGRGQVVQPDVEPVAKVEPELLPAPAPPSTPADAVTCSACGETLRPGARFCKQCGAPQVATCAHCGKALRAGARFCANCGQGV
jgi:predicted amidophosphoribosyltransferase